MKIYFNTNTFCQNKKYKYILKYFNKRYYCHKKPFITRLLHSVKPSNFKRVKCNKLSGAFKNKSRFLIELYKNKSFINKKTGIIYKYNIYGTITTDTTSEQSIVKYTDNAVVGNKLIAEKYDDSLTGRERQLDLQPTNKELDESKFKDMLYKKKDDFIILDKDDCGVLTEYNTPPLKEDIIEYYYEEDE